MSLWRDVKLAASDGACVVLEPVSPAIFAQYCTRFVDGFFVTIELLVLACALGAALAVPLALMRLSHRRLLRWPAAAYMYVFRGTPTLVQLWVLYFGVGAFGAEGLGPLWPVFRDAWTVGLMALSLNTAAYIAEVWRGGLANVPMGQIEAARAYGLSPITILRRIRAPQALRIAWPAYTNEVILLMKCSALVSTITVLDLMGQTRTVFSRNYDLWVFAYAALFYLLLAGLLTFVFRRVEKRLARGAV